MKRLLSMVFLFFCDALCKPFYTQLKMFPFSVKVGRFPLYKQIQFLHFRTVRKWRQQTIDTSIKPRHNIVFCLELTPGTDFHQMYLFMARTYEEDVICQILTEAATADVFIDAGAYLGYYALAVATACPHIKVLAFEPRPNAALLLQKNIKTNNLSNINVLQKALGATTGEALLYVPSCPEQSSLLETTNISQAINVELATIDTTIACQGIKCIIKIDTEGYEFEILAGMKKMLAENNCQVFLEYNPHVYHSLFGADYSTQNLTWLKNMGYSLYHTNRKPFNENSNKIEQQMLLLMKI